MYRAFGKRLFDFTAAVVAVIVLCPIILLIALAIKLLDPGPVIFKQKRVGLKGKEFQFYKFRSLPINTGDLPSDKLGQVSITLVGKVIRRTNLDELPQLLNIIKGDMSVVGPRPAIPSQDELVEVRRRNGALMCRPGLTGWAQINSYDGMTFVVKASLDADYAKDISFSGDIKIIFASFGYLLKPPPVY